MFGAELLVYAAGSECLIYKWEYNRQYFNRDICEVLGALLGELLSFDILFLYTSTLISIKDVRIL